MVPEKKNEKAEFILRYGKGMCSLTKPWSGSTLLRRRRQYLTVLTFALCMNDQVINFHYSIQSIHTLLTVS